MTSTASDLSLLSPRAPGQSSDAGSYLRQAWVHADSRCIKCGFCLPACPTYRETGLEAASPRGRLDLMYGAAQGVLSMEHIREPLALCLGCLACETACPSGIRYGDMLEAQRMDEAVRRSGSVPWLAQFALNTILLSPQWLKALAWGLYLYRISGVQSVIRGSGLLRLWPRLAQWEAAAPPLERPLNWRRSSGLLATGMPGERGVALVRGCVMDAALGAVHTATARVLNANAFQVYPARRETCCGALHLHAGDLPGARDLARQNIVAFEALGSIPLVVNSAGCGAHMKSYGHLLADDPEWKDRAQRFSHRVKDISEFLAAQVLRPPTGRVPVRAAYDAPCHLVHAQRVAEAPLKVLRQVPGLELVPLVEAEMCCGSAGSYSFSQPEMSARLLDRKMGHIAATGAQVIATGNPGCLLQLRLGAQRHDLPLRVLHPVELLAMAYEGEPDGEPGKFPPSKNG